MTKREYAEAVAKKVNGKVNEITKANGVVKFGISFEVENGISPCIYIDDMYEKEMPVDEAAENVLRLKEENSNVTFDPSILADYSKAKKYLTLRLYNKKSQFDVFRSAEEYGYDDLIIVPVFDLSDMIPGASVRIKGETIKSFGITKEQLFEDAKENIKPDNYTIQPMVELLAAITGQDEENFNSPDDPEIYVVTNKKKTCGAYGAIALADELRKKFPNGYTVIPSSIHEVIIVPGKGDDSELAAMIGDVNDTQVEREEQLGNKAYFIS